MILSINTKISRTSSGGLNQFLTLVKEHFEMSGHSVLFNLERTPADLILVTHPSESLIHSTMAEIRRFLVRHPETFFVHRINTCDEHRGYGDDNEKILELNKLADYTVFISSFLKDLYVGQGFDAGRPCSILMAGPAGNLPRN
jgi:hypothetical protein